MTTTRRWGLADPARSVRRLCLAALVGLLAGRAMGLPAVQRPASTARAAPLDASLAALARDAGIAAGQSGV